MCSEHTLRESSFHECHATLVDHQKKLEAVILHSNLMALVYISFVLVLHSSANGIVPILERHVCHRFQIEVVRFRAAVVVLTRVCLEPTHQTQCQLSVERKGSHKHLSVSLLALFDPLKLLS